MENKVLMYEGKAKKIFSTDNSDEVLVYYKDDATAFNGEKKASIASKGILNNSITSLLFEMLNEKGVKTHFIKKVSDREQICKKVEIIPLEVIVRNVAAGSMAKRYGLEEGTELKTTVFELSYKNDNLGDPLMNDYHAVAMEITTFDELYYIYGVAAEVNELLTEFFKAQNIKLIDFKLEFGRLNGEILLADEISPDTCRLWDMTTGEKLDKDRFRRDIGDLVEGYTEVLNRMMK
ncbi:phosphoribosylaminoimidazolesuccinocarboxamide synthase [Clostridium argentinense CDC 2741]|uniref:Phosphoribosylaminoimidazole-succinocarboxamide synthase n=1 Tax=Clostridium argentinense CDC 2741 TaxID=1418104 RepID=A0A0C1UG20_9CLOT|nr:phosphoribosylaminoimidazolesuccinocarboxamide synthase [Clostridium argentinense]ARC85846.1 phosphoribosylaminoimidazolesuccinocarboxamide synthase [Clostridium argentinense]KIE46340.1 phosphoribosylaminoimidazolesuccinocarboxamide synthase [Clostridium argentinense CDC 2741]NFF39931.1 phosphoribosylaminoimidazolesuccinocarboxamide synthase [Clostridium argentinense]NFP48562.1 phosphoribosylaminoimidazolesuccinocarboxamide synthase [Clostridium argentinense]NFP71170.1 phosphoribosylaminoim